MTILSLKGVAGHADGAKNPVLGSVTLELDNGAKETVNGADRFTIIVDGAPILVDATGLKDDALKLEERSKKGTWADVEPHPLASPFLDKAPGPHIAVKLRGAAVVPGEVIHILGEVVATELAGEAGSMRAPPPMRPAEIRAIAVAAGPFAQTFIDERRSERAPAAARPSAQRASSSLFPWLWIILLIGAAALFIVAAFTSRMVRFELGMLILIGIAMKKRVDMAPPVFRGREPAADEGGWAVFYVIATLVVLGSIVGFLIAAATALIAGTVNSSSSLALIVPALAAVLVALPVEAWSRVRQFNRIAKIILEAPMDARGDGAWRAIEGVVRDPTPVQWADAEAAIARKIEASKEPTVFVDDTFDIEAADERVAVDAAEACWATLVTRTKVETSVDKPITTGENGATADASATQEKTSKSVEEEWIPVGASVLAAGRVRRTEGDDGGGRMTSTGPESLLIFAVQPGRSARAELTSLVGVCRRSLVLLFVVAALAMAAAGAFQIAG